MGMDRLFSIIMFVISSIEVDLKRAGLASMITLAALVISSYVYRWRNPSCRGMLPPGSSGFPLIGETLQLIRPSSSNFDLTPFLKSRITRYGPIFRTNIAGMHTIISTDSEFNRFLLRQDGELMGASLENFVQGQIDVQFLEKFTRKFVIHNFGVELIKEKLLSQVEETANQTLSDWSSQESVEIKGSSITMTITLALQQIFSGDLEISPLHLSEMFNQFTQGIMSFPLNIPGTTHHLCLQIRKKIKSLIKKAVQKRLAAAARGENSNRGDLLDHIIADIGTHEQFSDEFVAEILFCLLFATVESISTAMAFTLKLLHEHPAVVEELAAEHEGILKRKEKVDAPITWSEYKSMTFTIHVINEVLRLENTAPGIFRRALTDIPANGYVIPKGWQIVIATSVTHVHSDHFQDPLSFNPWRWKNIEPDVVSKYFLPFGSGMRQCTGAEYGKAYLCTFLHVLLTKYRFTMVKNARIVRAPILSFPDGIHMNISAKSN